MAKKKLFLNPGTMMATEFLVALSKQLELYRKQFPGAAGISTLLKRSLRKKAIREWIGKKTARELAYEVEDKLHTLIAQAEFERAINHSLGMVEHLPAPARSRLTLMQVGANGALTPVKQKGAKRANNDDTDFRNATFVGLPVPRKGVRRAKTNA